VNFVIKLQYMLFIECTPHAYMISNGFEKVQEISSYAQPLVIALIVIFALESSKKISHNQSSALP